MASILPFLSLIIFSSVSGSFPGIPEPNIKLLQRADGGDYRLPTNTVPISYDIVLEPFFDPEFTFEGKISIAIEVIEETDTITMHADQLGNFDNILIDGIDDVSIEIESDSIKIDTSDRQFLTIPIGRTVDAGAKLTLSMTYTGTLKHDDNAGFYRASYVEDGEIKWFATTQFEWTFARRAFPCYDEPALKATFKITLIRPADYNTLSNMEIESHFHKDDKIADVYEETVQMSTYLVAFVVSEMTSTDVKENQKVYAPKSLIQDGRGEYARDVGIDTLKAMETFTDVKYALKKMYQVSIPNEYFTFGAMENWGLVTYRETALLYKEGLSTSSEKQSIATIIAHEYGHQWFGNLVSPSWWKYIWLNEGFATYFENYACSIAEPEMRTMEQFLTHTVQRAMETDATETTRAMSTDAASPEQIDSLFDRIAYDKSGSVIRMMEHMLTTDVFTEGLKIYLSKMAYGAAVATDLWAAMQEAVEKLEPNILQGLEVKDVMETWELQTGFPVLNVKRGDGKITVSQARYFHDAPQEEYNTIWKVPINYATASDLDFEDTKATYWLTEATQDFDVALEDDEWIILNKKGTGYYRVNYDEENWRLIIEYLNSENYDKIHVLNRAQLLNDAINLARYGKLSYNTTMNLIYYLRRETDYLPLYVFFNGLSNLDKFIMNTEQYDIFKDFVKEILQAAYDKLGTDDTGAHTEKLNRINVLTWLCRYGHESCVAAMDTQLSKLSPASPDLQTVVYCGGQKRTDHSEDKLKFLLDRYFGDVAENLEKSRILSAIGCSTSEDILTRVLNIAISKDEEYKFTSSQITSAFSSVYGQSDIGLRVALDFVINNFEDIDEKLTVEEVGSIIQGISERLTNLEQMMKWGSFLENLSEEMQITHGNAILIGSISMVANALWADEHLKAITEFIVAYGSGYVFAISIPLLILATLSHIIV